MTVNPAIPPSSSDTKINVLVRAQTGGPYHPPRGLQQHNSSLLLHPVRSRQHRNLSPPPPLSSSPTKPWAYRVTGTSGGSRPPSSLPSQHLASPL
ncbi:hypothetical protein K440DRAFT_212953 [Wilcoxina mikolae CBS 423.85]|nr:hypothetical protein K440DRAFT_212953 [Wilcoxina mikolae CBS 423.85]